MTGAVRDALAAIAGGHDGHGPVRTEIEVSWRRVLAAGLDPERISVPKAEIDTDSQVYRLATPVAKSLTAQIGGAPFSVVVTDHEGQVLWRWADDRRLRRRLDAVFLVPGASFAEHVAGTNAIGTALAQRSTSVVHGDEHFADAFTGTACAAAPVHDPTTGRITAVLNLSCAAADASPLMLPLVRRAAIDVEDRLLDGSGIAKRALLHCFLRVRRRAKQPFVLVNGHTAVMNAAADRLVAPDDEPVLVSLAHAFLDGSEPATKLTLSTGATVAVSAEALAEPELGSVVLLQLRTAVRERSVGLHNGGGLAVLTETERSVTDLVARGLTNRQVGEKLFVSRHTVDAHLRSIFRKLHVSSRVELARVVLAAGRSEDQGAS
ncbi:MAG: LuxR C-terminal-related transcriptional regulator [Acidimicrobiales bacterium]